MGRISRPEGRNRGAVDPDAFVRWTYAEALAHPTAPVNAAMGAQLGHYHRRRPDCPQVRSRRPTNDAPDSGRGALKPRGAKPPAPPPPLKKKKNFSPPRPPSPLPLPCKDHCLMPIKLPLPILPALYCARAPKGCGSNG